MRQLRYKVYLLTEKLIQKLRDRTTRTGRYILLLCLVSLVFGLNTYSTMLYQMAGVLLATLVIAFPFSLKFTPQISITRHLPDTCTAGEKFTYNLSITAPDTNWVKGIEFHEAPLHSLPTYEEFKASPEEGEEQRNLIDRLLKYYRWSWLVNKKKHVHSPTVSLGEIPPGNQVGIETSITVKNRGLQHIQGYVLQRADPFGIFKKKVHLSGEKNILVLPKLYPISNLNLMGSRKYHQGGLIQGAQFGDSQEFNSLREYQAGDSIRHIDWKATARAQKPILRQYQDEYYSRYGIILDGFSPLEFCPLFEEAVSIGASIVTAQHSSNHVVDLLFAGKDSVTSATMGKGLADQHHILEILACITTCRDGSFSDLAKLVENHVHLLSGAVLIFIDMDSRRKQLLTFLNAMAIPFQAILVTRDKQESREQLKELGQLPPLSLISLNRGIEEVQLQ